MQREQQITTRFSFRFRSGLCHHVICSEERSLREPLIEKA